MNRQYYQQIGFLLDGLSASFPIWLEAEERYAAEQAIQELKQQAREICQGIEAYESRNSGLQ